MTQVTPISQETRKAIYMERNTPCPCCGLPPPLKEVAARHGVSIAAACKIANTRGFKE